MLVFRSFRWGLLKNLNKIILYALQTRMRPCGRSFDISCQPIALLEVPNFTSFTCFTCSTRFTGSTKKKAPQPKIAVPSPYLLYKLYELDKLSN